MSGRVLSRLSALAASAALIAGGILASAPAASAVTAGDPSPQTFHCRVLVDSEILFFHVELHQTAVVVATSAVEAENDAVTKVNADLPSGAAAVSATCTAIA